MSHHLNPNSMYCEGCGSSAQSLCNDRPISASSETWTGRPWNAPNMIAEFLGLVDSGVVEIRLGQVLYRRAGAASFLQLGRVTLYRSGRCRKLVVRTKR